MKENIEKTYITKSQTHKLDSFLEHIAVSHNLYNYIGAISMAINYALDVLNDDAIIVKTAFVYQLFVITMIFQK